ncbi:MAG: hypothetical protein WA705_01370 [Candidatus Ozemobacteraceae bacterium]
MTCRKFLDWLEQHGEDVPGAGWECLLAHVQGCPDCLIAKRNRSALREVLATLPEPPLPIGIATSISQNIDLAGAQEDDLPPTWLDRLFESMLKPLELGLSFACIALIIGLSWSHSTENSSPLPGNPFSAIHARGHRSSPANPNSVEAPKRPGESLVRLTPEEISAFRQKLSNYRLQHPEMDTAPVSHSGVALAHWSGSGQ